MLLAQLAVRAMHAQVPITAYLANVVVKLQKLVEGQGVGKRVPPAAVVTEYVTVEKPAVQTAACPMKRGMYVVGKSIANLGVSVALDRLHAVLMSGNAVETLV